MEDKKVKFSELHWTIKLGVIGGLISLFVWGSAFLGGFMQGLMS